MAVLFLRDSTAWVHDVDLTSNLKKATLKTSAQELDVTVFAGGGYRTRLGGLRDIDFAADGFFDSTPDASMFASLGVADRVYTLSPEGAETKTAYLFQAGRFNYELYGQVGEAAPFAVDAKSSNGVGIVRGQMAKAKANVSATGATGSGLNLGAVGAAQFLYATLHVFTAGTTVTVVVESDTSNAFAAPTTRLTMGPITTTGGTFAARLAGPLTDTWYRFRVSAITGTFSLAGAIGVGS